MGENKKTISILSRAAMITFAVTFVIGIIVTAIDDGVAGTIVKNRKPKKSVSKQQSEESKSVFKNNNLEN